jgi:hypothetical protein
MKMKNKWIIAVIISSLFFLTAVSVEAADVTITDGTHDVSQIDYLTGETTVITSSPDVDVDNLDITQATYTAQGIHVTLTVTVVGIIENRGKLIDFYSGEIPLNIIDAVEYTFDLSTSEQDYSVSYSNGTGQLLSGSDQFNLTSSNFSISGSTLSAYIDLLSAEETYTSLSVTSTYIKANISDLESGLIYISDVAPNPELAILEAYAYDTGSVDESIQFNATIEPLTGQPPYTYHWNFGDQKTSTEQNPMHAYTKAGTYTYNFTVTDNAGATASETGTITITQEGGGGTGGMSSQLILFLAILLIIIVVGVVIIVWIIRRR